jgi:NADPH:quinone reductase-like Zn-dependent oxidoreductase/NAD(P)-dependent dehydrogenase (short-subunit alcohol dehydrogenase family)/SAM-dependent methyltransferase/acyl carrier protein
MVLPAVGYLEMAIAAVHAIQRKNQDSVSSMTLDAVTFQQALLLDSTPTVQLVLTPEGHHENQRHRFEILSMALANPSCSGDTHDRSSTDAQWICHASGSVNQTDTSFLKNSNRITLKAAQIQCANEIPVAPCYERLQMQGITYGESFRALQAIWTGDNQVLSRLQLPVNLHSTGHHYRLHPVVLDACLQSIAAIPTLGGFANAIDLPSTQTFLPAAVEQVQLHAVHGAEIDFWSHVQIVKTSPGKELAKSAIQWITVDIDLFSLAGVRLVTLKGLRLQPATVDRVLPPPHPVIEEWFYRLDWQPAPLSSPLVSPTEIAQQLRQWFAAAIATPAIQSYQQLLPQLDELCIGYIRQALIQLSGDPAILHGLDIGALDAAILSEQWGILPSQHRLFHRLLEALSQHPSALAGNDESPLKTAHVTDLQTQLQARYPEAQAELRLIQRCGENLAAVLTGQVDPLTLLFPEGDLTDLTQLYQSSPGSRVMNDGVKQAVLAATAHHTTPCRILEIGAGTGGTTAHLLPHIGDVEYLFTDISPLFLTKARERFADYPTVRYHLLDVESLPDRQGIQHESYDLVIASNVLHATADVAQALSHVRSLLAPGGQLILLEGTQPLLWLDLIFGMTDGWWKRSTHPLLSGSEWQEHLTSGGFDDVVSLMPVQDANLPQSIILAAVPQFQSSEKRLILTGGNDPFGNALSNALGGQYLSIDPLDPAALQARFETLDEPWPDHIIYLIDAPPNPSHGDELEVLMRRSLLGLLYLVQTLPRHSSDPMPQLTVVTRGAIDGPIPSAAWGLSRVIALEFPMLRCRRIDLGGDMSLEQQIEVLCQEIERGLVEQAFGSTASADVAYRQGERCVARLARVNDILDGDLDQAGNSQAANLLTIPSESYALSLSEKGTPDYLQLVSVARQQPHPGEVEIRVQAAGLNFIDVLDSLGLLPVERDWLGVECVGEVVAVGDAVEAIAVGETVMAIAPGSFRRYVTVPAELVVTIPKNLSMQEAATIPANSLTAYYALKQVAALNPGDRILIHAAAGGTGMAAVKLAQAMGAEVFATASPHKWDALKSLGVTYVMNSRTLDFADEIMAWTNRQGVDVVLNSLSGMFIEKGLSVLSPQGCFLEIGKRGIWSAEQVAQVRPDVTYHVIDLMTVARQDPQQIQRMLQALSVQFESGNLAPVPHRSFSITQARQAFRHMQQAQHVGKIVLEFASDALIHSESTYLITGGLGGLGLETAAWLVAQGARHLALVSRRPAHAQALHTIDKLREQGAEVLVLQADVANEESLKAALVQLNQTLPPLRGVIHAAGVLEDGVVQQLTWEQMQSVLAPKVWGAWNLHQLTGFGLPSQRESHPLDFFVMYSSAAALIGSPGQGSHVAANSFLDALAHYRRRLGLPALSINWGPWSEVGSAVTTTQQMQSRGMGAIAPKAGLQALSTLLSQTTLTQVGVMPIHWPQFRQQGICQDPFFANFAERETIAAGSDGSVTQHSDPDWLVQLRNLPQRHWTGFLTQSLQSEVAAVLVLPGGKQPDPTVSFFDMGMDSLMAVELKNRLDRKLGSPIPSTALFEFPTVQALATHLVEKLLTEKQGTEKLMAQKSGDAQENQVSAPNRPPVPDIARDTASDEAPDLTLDLPMTPEIAAELAALEALLDPP